MEHHLSLTACQITFVAMDGVEAAKVEIRAWLTRLGALMDGVASVQVMVTATDERRQQRLHQVRMDLTFIDGAVVRVALDHPSNLAHEDLYVAIRNAFRAARRLLEEHVRTHGRTPPAATAVNPEPVPSLAALLPPDTIDSQHETQPKA